MSPSEKGGTLDFSDFGNLSSSTNNSYPEGMKNIDGEEYKKTLKQSSNDDDSASNSKCDNDDKTINRERFEIETANNNLHLDFLLISLTDLVKEKYETEKSACSGKVDDPEIKLDFEFFLKRFIDAMLQPDVIDSCIAKALS